MDKSNTDKKLLSVRPKIALGSRKRNNRQITIAKLFALHANSIRSWWQLKRLRAEPASIS